MSENPNFELSDNDKVSEKPEGGLKNKLQTAGALGLVALTALAGEACSPERGNDAEQVGGQDKQTEAQKRYMSPNPALLAEYRHNIHTGNFPAEGQKERTLARALEIIILKGMSVDKGSRVDVEARGTVPVQIKIDGQVVPVGLDDYTAEELQLVRMTVGTFELKGGATRQNVGQEDGEKISPMVEKIFKEKKKKSSSETGKKIYISPDFKDF